MIDTADWTTSISAERILANRGNLFLLCDWCGSISDRRLNAPTMAQSNPRVAETDAADRIDWCLIFPVAARRFRRTYFCMN